jgi:hypothetical protein
MMLISAGADTIIQKATTGEVNWGQVAVSGALGGIGGLGVAGRLGATGWKAAAINGAVSGGVGGAGMGGYRYATGPGPHSVSGFLSATTTGAVQGAVLGGAGGAGGHGLVTGVRTLRGTRAVPGGTVLTTPSDTFGQYAGKAKPIPGHHDVAIHGSPTDFGRTPGAWGSGENFNHRVLARLIQNDPSYPGGDIRLISCQTGSLPDGAAQNLANKMGVNVRAPDDTVWAWPNGRLTIGPTANSNSGAWQDFTPGPP